MALQREDYGWLEAGTTLYIEQQPNKSFIPREGLSFASREVVTMEAYKQLEADHKEMVARNQVLRDRPDLPIERARGYDELISIIAALRQAKPPHASEYHKLMNVNNDLRFEIKRRDNKYDELMNERDLLKVENAKLVETAERNNHLLFEGSVKINNLVNEKESLIHNHVLKVEYLKGEIANEHAMWVSYKETVELQAKEINEAKAMLLTVDNALKELIHQVDAGKHRNA